MQRFIQFIGVLAVAIGAGLLGFGNTLAIPLDAATITSLATSRDEPSDIVMYVAISTGFGIGFLLFGVLALAVPWINRLEKSCSNGFGESTARTITLMTIWLSNAMVLTFGVFRVDWSGSTGTGALLLVVGMAFSATTIASAFVCGWKPWLKTSHGIDPPLRDQPT